MSGPDLGLMLRCPSQTSETITAISQIDQRTRRPTPYSRDKRHLGCESFVRCQVGCDLDDRHFKAGSLSVSNDRRLVPIALPAWLADVIIAAIALAFANVKWLPGIRPEKSVYVEISLQL